MREAESATRIANNALNVDRRTVSLISHRSTVDTLPLANRPNLQAALHALRRVIDPAEDIVFLFLTSHGGEGGIAAAFDPLAPNDLWAEEVREALDEAGILWRIVVVSACYSGSFIEPLASPRTLVVTASAADRPSFGCEPDNAWTYFGEAYFADGLAATRDPVAAFNVALRVVDEREQAEGLPPSRPQLLLGAGLDRQLARWRDQRGQP